LNLLFADFKKKNCHLRNPDICFDLNGPDESSMLLLADHSGFSVTGTLSKIPETDKSFFQSFYINSPGNVHLEVDYRLG
jgi:hypothetical protein